MEPTAPARSRFVRDLRWLVPLWLVLALGLGVYTGIEDGTTSGLEVGGGCLVLGIALTPLIWLRFNGGHVGRPGDGFAAAKRVGLAIAWAVAVPAVFFALASLLG